MTYKLKGIVHPIVHFWVNYPFNEKKHFIKELNPLILTSETESSDEGPMCMPRAILSDLISIDYNLKPIYHSFRD